MNIKNKIIVAGSEGLLGQVLCKSLSEEYDVIPLDIKNGHDITNQEKIRDILKNHKNAYGLVNLFAINPQPNEINLKPEEISLDSLRDYMEVNVIALYSICIEFSKICCENASIVNFSSIHGVLSPKHFIYENNFVKHPGYTISKSAVLGLSKYLATYFSSSIRVNTIISGGVENKQSDVFIKNYSQMTPLNRMMDKSEISSSVKYLLSKDSSYVTGSEVVVDGGWTSW
jgi:NAD(P)-dependent dehydrogenase (short-subunit alcohol dehydrogenase family)|tara:strand:- start:1602 stop:2288 length:687 start_codon:yes stop_codon:yes gene_type:complete